MNFNLEHFELHFPSELLPAGENLYDNNAISMFEEIQRNLWTFEVEDGKTHEVEVLISPKKVKSYSCDCSYFADHKCCKHIIASLYLLRLEKTENVKTKHSMVFSAPKKLSVPNILKQIPEEDLKNFVRNYAKINKAFSTALKANFARSIELFDNELKYESILNGIIKPATDIDYKVSFQAIKQFLRVSEQFDAQFEDSLSLKQYTEAYYIVKALLAKTAYVNHWTLSENDQITSLNKHLHQQLALLVSLEIAPDLKSEILSFCQDLTSRSYYHVSDPKENLFMILLKYEKVKEHLLPSVGLLSSKSKSDQLHYRELEYIWIIRQNFVQHHFPFASEEIPILGSQAIFRVCEILEEQEAYVGLLNFIEFFKVKGKIRDLFLSKKYVRALVKLGKKEELRSEFMDFIMLFKDLYFYEVLREAFPDSYEAYYEILSRKLANKKGIEYQRLYLNLQQMEGKTEKLNEFLMGSNYGVALAPEFAEHIKNNSEELSEVVVTVSDNYLSEYIGKESAAEMKSLLLFLRNRAYSDAFTKLRNHIISDYPERITLAEEVKNI